MKEVTEIEAQLLAQEMGEVKVPSESVELAIKLMQENFKGKSVGFVREVFYEALYEIKERLVIS